MSDNQRASIWQRLQGRPALLAGGAGLAALVLALTACGGGGDSGDATGSPTPTATVSVAPTPTPSGPLPAVTDVAPELDFFGELAAVNSHPVTAIFDSTADSLALADGAFVEVPAGAFPGATELSVAIIDLLFEKYIVDPPEARIYVLSTSADVVLGAPLVLEVPKPADSVTVTRFVDGDWLPVDVPAGPTTRVEIANLSSPAVRRGWSTQTPLKQTIAVSDNFVQESDEPSVYDALRADIKSSSNSVGANFLLQCSVAVATIFPNAADSEFLFLLGLSACVQALSDSGLLDEGDELDLDCVTDRIDTGKTIEEAADECTQRNDEPSPSQSAAPQPEPDADPDPAPASKITGTLAPGIASSSPAVDQCIERPDFDAIFCDYTFNVTMDYVVSGLPANVSCTFPGQSSDFFALDSGNRLDLSALEGLASRGPMAVAVFDPSGSPRFSNPVSVECVLSHPIEGEVGSFRRLDDHTFTLDLPNVAKIDGCLGAGCPVP